MTRQQFVRWLTTVIGVILCLSVVPAVAAAPVTVYYFHSTARCAECLQIEKMTGDILQKDFSRELADGSLVWKPLNADLPENTHYVFDFDLVANELVVASDSREHHGVWDKLPEVWSLAHAPEQLREKLVRMIRQALAAVD